MIHLSVTQALAGFFAAIGLYNTLIYFVTGDRAFLWYSVLMDTVAGVQFVFAPHLIGVAGADALQIYRIAIFALYFCAQAVFAWTFLRVPVRFPRRAQAIAGLLAANLLALGVDRLLPATLLHRSVDHVLFIALLAACASAAWTGSFGGQDDARYHLMAYASMTFFALASAVSDFAGLAAWPIYFFQIGALLQAALLTLALASRYFKLDPLTGVKSRRAFDEALIHGFRISRKQHAGLAVIVVSIHALKEYEARNGRMAGDAMLRRVANLCSGCCRDRADVFARYGDEAFAAIIPRVSKDDAESIAQRMRDLVEDACLTTVGIGVCAIEEAHSAKGIVQRAAQRSARDAIGRARIPDAAAL